MKNASIGDLAGIDIAWELRLEMYVKDPIRQFLGQKTSSKLIAEALNTGINRQKLDELIKEMEALADNLEDIGEKCPDTAVLNKDRSNSEKH